MILTISFISAVSQRMGPHTFKDATASELLTDATGATKQMSSRRLSGSSHCVRSVVGQHHAMLLRVAPVGHSTLELPSGRTISTGSGFWQESHLLGWIGKTINENLCVARHDKPPV